MRGLWLWAVIFSVMGGIGESEARLLNIGGSLSVNYNRSMTFSGSDAGATSTSVNSFGQQYNLGISGDAYKLGGYGAHVSWLEQVVNLEDTDQKNRFNVTDYRLTFNLFPQWSPLSLTRQRTVRKTDLELQTLGITTKDRIDSLSANWTMSIRQLPRLIFNYQQSELNTAAPGTFLTRSASAFTDTVMGVTRIAVGYQFSETDISSSEPSRSHGLNLDTGSEVTTHLTVTAYGRYTTSRLPENVTVPGVTLFQERSFGTAALYHPRLHWWDGSVSYNYSENPFFNEFRSQAVQGSANVRYDGKTDSSFGARYLHFSVIDSTVDSQSGDASLNYRPIFGLSTGVGGSAGLTSTHETGTGGADSLFQNYRYNINYAKPYQLIQYRASYQLSYGQADTRPSGFNSRDLGSGVSFGIDNTNVRIIHVGLNTTYSNIQRVTESVRTEQSSYLIQPSADSSYFKDLFIRGDALGLRAQGNYSDTTGSGVEGRVISGDLAANYQTPFGLAVSEAYRIEGYPKELLLDRQTLTSLVQYSTYFAYNISMILSLRDVVEDNRYREDVNRAEGSVTLNYQVGLLTLGAQFQEIETRTAGSRYKTRSIMGRATRAF